MPKANDFGKRLTSVGRKYQRSLTCSTRAARDSVRNMPTPPATKQWQCHHCGQPNLERAVICGGCSEERDMRPVIEDERKAS